MDFLVTIDDGSQFLAHHGTKGMKWGVWNDETKRKYGVLSKSVAGGGGGGSDDDEGDKKVPGVTSGNYHDDVQKLEEDIVTKAGEGIVDIVNTHLVDIQTGNISKAEAQVLAVVNAAATGLTGEALIYNPAGKPAWGQDKKTPVFIGK